MISILGLSDKDLRWFWVLSANNALKTVTAFCVAQGDARHSSVHTDNGCLDV